MLEAHPPHEAIHTWKDFGIHIATIVIGLLIALGLEQSVEWMHHRQQLRETREELATELDENRNVVLAFDQERAQRIQSELERDMALLRAHQSSGSPLTDPLDYSWDFRRFPDAAWQAAKQNGSLSLMPYDELKRSAFAYTVLGNIMDASTALSTALEVSGALAKSAPDGDLSTRDTEALIAATADARGKLAFARFLLNVAAVRLQPQGAPSAAVAR